METPSYGPCGSCGQARKVVYVRCAKCAAAICWDTCCQSIKTAVGKTVEFTYQCAKH